MVTVAREMAPERVRFITMALLFFANAVVETSNEVVATSGFISNLSYYTPEVHQASGVIPPALR